MVTGEMVEELVLSGADIIKVGIGPGDYSRCSKQYDCYAANRIKLRWAPELEMEGNHMRTTELNDAKYDVDDPPATRIIMYTN